MLSPISGRGHVGDTPESARNARPKPAEAPKPQAARPAATAEISAEGRAAAARAASEQQVEWATREAARNGGPNRQDAAVAASQLLRRQMERATA